MLKDDELLTISQVAQRLPTRPNISTVFRWVTRGVRNRKLETVLIGGRRYVRASDLIAFLTGLNDVGQEPSTNSRNKRVIDAHNELIREGFLTPPNLTA